jgi:hypothetical protein
VKTPDHPKNALDQKSPGSDDLRNLIELIKPKTKLHESNREERIKKLELKHNSDLTFKPRTKIYKAPAHVKTLKLRIEQP